MVNKLSQFVFDKVGVPTYQKFLNLSSLRQKLISSNVANVSTPGYRAKDINFQQEFAKATSKGSELAGTVTHSSHIPLGQHEARAPRVIEQEMVGGEMNAVDIDQEVSSLAKNELLYTTAARLLQRKFDALRTAITSG